MTALTAWFRDRLPVSEERLAEFTSEPVPYHIKRWWFALGGTPAYLFMVQIVTGILLAVYYEPSTARAYASVRYITEEAAFGWYLRSLHKWAATLMIASVILHQMRVFFTGAYRAPREINWMVGMCLLVAVLLTGFTGYSLVFEQLSFWGATVGANIMDTVPVLGPPLKALLLGGESYNAHTLPRFYVLHAAVLPATIATLVVVHIAIIRIQGITPYKFSDEPEGPPRTFKFFPDHVTTEMVIALVLMILLSALATIFPAMMGPVANPLVTPEVIKPEWFFYVAFRWLKLFTGTAAVLSMGLIVLVMFGWPFIDAQIRARTRFQEASVWFGILAVLAIIALTVWEAVVAH